MRIVILYNTSWYVFLLRRNLIASLLQAGHTVTVVAPRDAYTERVQQLGVSFVPISMNATGTSPIKEMVTLGEIYEALRSLRPDVVLSFTVKCNLYAGLCRRLLSFHHVANVSGLGQSFDTSSLANKAIRRLYRTALSQTHTIFFQNKEDREMLVQQKIVSMAQTEVIPGSGVDLRHFCPSQSQSNRRGSRSFLMLGRLLPKKGFVAFMEAAATLKDRYGDAAAFWILGAPDFERPESVELLEQIISRHARGTIRYLQSTDDVIPYLREADAVVLPSTYNEGVPRSLLEALACGKPVITTNWKGCRETVEPGRNGYLVLPDNTESLIRAMTQILECSQQTLETLGRNSRLIAEERFNEETVLSAYHRAISHLRVSSLEQDAPRAATIPIEPEGPYVELSHAQDSIQTHIRRARHAME
jgi:glycosyltransferase involved in cell wall biosynthesis